jgi:hypothetical protein
MAFMNQERKNELAPAIKNVCKKYGVKATISVRHHSTLVVTIQESKFDVNGHDQVNYYHIDDHYEGEKAAFLNELKDAMMVGNHDDSDSMTDYFNVGWYISINFGQWNKPHRKLQAA